MVELVQRKLVDLVPGKTFRDVGIDFRVSGGRFCRLVTIYRSVCYKVKNPDLLARGLQLVRQGKEYV